MPSAAESAPESLARELLDAQVRHHLERLTGDQLAGTVARFAGTLLDASGEHEIGALVDREALTDVVVRALATVPGSAAVAAIVEMAVDVAHEGPATPYPLGELVERDRVEALVDELLALTPVVERALERLTASPLVGAAASRFMGRIVGEVVNANKAVADKVPGLGSIVSLGTSAASRVMGAADKQLEGLLGETMGKGGTYAVSRLNKIVVETLRDPTTREAVLQVWDLAAQEPVVGTGRRPGRDEVSGVVDAVHDLVVGALATEHVAELGAVVVEAFLERFGGYSPTELLAELDLDRDQLVADLVRLAPPVVEALRESGDLERLVREQLAPFWTSPEALAILDRPDPV
ncbi:hypothetical protein [Nocardioides sp. SYSU D00038]|uniref:hypothetical protein n=1 Tax=Nocardioides sp. SYSU D00038 TaxID=2812554 RepID=UPI0019682FFF|nr:hypothetical protein [Nocardioides sp. SYSU D00038]